ncbi:farnesol dehydrogenase-like [Lutzomyia longipalpis]|uniref:farnesol dehydrogenase-like n=1 Tax=Lutzomyia longipalpis TaxID=7200 RepID=UPI0024839F87|nr:farnesol dehydrogenase-like [Lutzomyia longipalpis]
MDRWIGKVAVVTGASAGIGAEIVKDLAKAGICVVGLARRAERVEALKDGLPEEFRKNLHAMRCDVANEEEIVATFAKIVEKFGGVDILVNNAGIGKFDVKLTERGSASSVNEIVKTNLMGVINCTREAVASMRDRDVAGQVIHINSLLGHKVTMPPSGVDSNLNVYPATKFAISALTESYQFEMVAENRKIKFSSVSPGVVATEFFDETTLKNLQHFPHLLSSDISQAVLYILSTPSHVNIQDVLIKPLGCRY